MEQAGGGRAPPPQLPLFQESCPEALCGKGGRGPGSFCSCHLSQGKTCSKPHSAAHMVLIPRADKAWTWGRGRAADPGAEVLGAGGGGSATSGKALAAAVQILGPRGREIQEE